MRDPRQTVATPSTRAHVLVGVCLGIAAIATLLAGRLAVSIFAAILLLLAYYDLRRLLEEVYHPISVVIGGLAVVGFLWCGYVGELELLPAVAGAEILALLVSRIAMNEAGRPMSGITGDFAATLGASGVVGVLGAHILLIRAVPGVGFRGLVAFGVMAVANDVIAFFVGRLRGRRALNKQVSAQKTWEGAVAGFGASVLVGLIVGFVSQPPFSPASGLLFGLGVGVLVPLGDLAFSVNKRSAGVKHSGTYFGTAGGALDAIDGVLFAAPAFYWAFRTIAL